MRSRTIAGRVTSPRDSAGVHGPLCTWSGSESAFVLSCGRCITTGVSAAESRRGCPAASARAPGAPAAATSASESESALSNALSLTVCERVSRTRGAADESECAETDVPLLSCAESTSPPLPLPLLSVISLASALPGGKYRGSKYPFGSVPVAVVRFGLDIA